jgi:predicted esterase
MAASSSATKLIDTAYIIKSKDKHRHSLIWFHGFGDSSDGYKDIFTQIQPPNTRIVLPNAPKRWVTIQGRRHHIQSWYEHDKSAVEEGLKVIESVNELIDEELKLVDDASHIIIGGFRYFHKHPIFVIILIIYFLVKEVVYH